MDKLKKFYTMLGNNNKERFTRFLLLIITIFVCIMLIINAGYDKTKGGLFGGCYWKPADISIKKGVSSPMREVKE